MNKIIFCLIILIFLFQSCYNKEGIDISDYPKSTLGFFELPLKIQRTLEDNEKIITETYRDTVFSLDKGISFKHYKKNIHKKGWLYEVNNNEDYFVLNDKVYRKSGNNGKPFIYHKGALYYGDLDIYNDVRDRRYFQVLLDNRK